MRNHEKSGNIWKHFSWKILTIRGNLSESSDDWYYDDL